MADRRMRMDVSVPRTPPRWVVYAVPVIFAAAVIGLDRLWPGTVTVVDVGFLLVQGVVCLILAAISGVPGWMGHVRGRVVLAVAGVSLLAVAVMKILEALG